MTGLGLVLGLGGLDLGLGLDKNHDCVNCECEYRVGILVGKCRICIYMRLRYKKSVLKKNLCICLTKLPHP